jgi:CheY-like chemotaxis protein
MTIEMLEELGHRISGEAGRIEPALAMARSAEFDLAILDVNVGGRMITPVAEIVELRKRPIIFATGYAPDAIPEPFRDRPALRKPFMLEKLQHTINLTMAALGAG